MVQRMCDKGVATWTHTVFKREKSKQQSKENDDEVEPTEDGPNGNNSKETKKKEQEKVEYEVWTDGVLSLTEKAFPFGRP